MRRKCNPYYMADVRRKKKSKQVHCMACGKFMHDDQPKCQWKVCKACIVKQERHLKKLLK